MAQAFVDGSYFMLHNDPKTYGKTMYAECGALMNVCGSLSTVEKDKISMMKLLRRFGSVNV